MINGKELNKLRELLSDCNNESACKEDGLYDEIRSAIESGSYDKIWDLVSIINDAMELLKYVDDSGALTMKSKEISDFVKEYQDLT